ncbi:MAG: hypothetical protein B7C54_10115 [Acidimicrobiales bacterium mtb01]|nr:TetR/AcrR family transcriptional regulator [Actinomycetota bacterium]TEX45986.1 MAG: hypothetical protein B7C54_10115 [Acidimicrobiales bacterium mtb01]
MTVRSIRQPWPHVSTRSGTGAPAILEAVSREKKTSSRLGRPPATDSADTRRTILDVARAAFADRGFEVTTNREIATEAGITPAALYHYFPSKLDLFVAVHHDTRERVLARFNDAIDDVLGFVPRLEAILDESHRMNTEDPSLARFLGAVRVDVARHPEFEMALQVDQAALDAFFRSIVDHGVDTGEIDRTRRALVLSFVATTLTGLTTGQSASDRQHALAVEAIKAAVRGDLVARLPQT